MQSRIDQTHFLSQVRFVTANFAQLQGLRMVPIGIFLLFVLALELTGVLEARLVLPLADRAKLLTRVGYVFWVMLVLALVAPLYYRLRFGEVDGFDRQVRNRWLTTAVVGFFVLARVDRVLHLPVSLSLFLVSASFVVAAWRDGWIRPYYLAVAAAWMSAAWVPDLAVQGHLKLTLCGLGGLTFIALGIGDHLLLSRTLNSSRTGA